MNYLNSKMRKVWLISVAGVFLVGLIIFGNYWIKTQPIWVTSKIVDEKILDKTFPKNKKIVAFIEEHGKAIAHNYEDVVCTEFVIEVISHFSPLSNQEKNQIRIITTENLVNLIKNDSPIIKGTQTALIQNAKGIEIEKIEEVKPGDFVQFWNQYQGKAYGHCGIVLKIEPHNSLTLYSSHPLTNGYGKQKFLWPDKVFFARLR